MKIFNSQTYTSFSIVMLLIAVIGFSCKKSPIDNVKLIINPNVIKYSMLLDISDAANKTVRPQNVKISIGGKDAENIYEISGSKAFKVVDGILNIGLGPMRIPTSSNPAVFDVTISADGYLPITQELNITAAKTNQIVKLKLINLNNPPAGMQIVQQDIPLVGGVIKGQTSIKVSATGMQKRVLTAGISGVNPTKSAFDDGQTNTILPDGTTFYYLKRVVTGTATSIVKEPIYSQVNIPLDEGNGTAYYDRLEGYYDKQVIADVVEYQKVKVTSDKVKVIAIYAVGENLNYSVYPYDAYTPFQVSLLTGEKIPEDQILYKTAVAKKLIGFRFTAKVENNIETDVSPDQAFNWYTSFVLDPKTINPVTGAAIKAGDMIETGIDVVSGTTLRTPIIEETLSSGAKELRANTQTTDAGYYYRAIYLEDYNFNFNTAFGGSIVDLENLTGFLSVKIKTGGKTLPGAYSGFNPGSGVIEVSGKVRSFDPIIITSDYGVSYWGQFFKGTLTSSATVDIFTVAQIKPEPVVTFEVTNECAAQNRIYTTNAFAAIRAEDGSASGYANIVDGKWSSNGLVSGKTYISKITIKGLTVTETTKITKTNFEQRFIDKFDVCKMF